MKDEEKNIIGCISRNISYYVLAMPAFATPNQEVIENQAEI